MLYFIQNERTNDVKIGHAIDPFKRLATLQTGSADILRLLATIPGGREEESHWHKRFQRFRIQGEWFRGETELLDAIRKANIGTCAKCRWWRPHGPAGFPPDTYRHGDCRINPPVAGEPCESGQAVWPVTHCTDWCGKFEEK